MQHSSTHTAATSILSAAIALMAITGCQELPADDGRTITAAAGDDLVTPAVVTDFPQDEVVVAKSAPISTEPFPVKTVSNYRDFVTGNRAAACPPDYRVGFTAFGRSHVSAGGLTFLGYSTTITNVGGGWVPGGGTFVAPCAGLYSFTSTFVKDSYYYGGTMDDVYIFMTKNGGSVGFAWSGEGAGRRGTGTHTVTLLLNIGDYVQTFAGSDGGPTRHLSSYEFTGVLVRE